MPEARPSPAAGCCGRCCRCRARRCSSILRAARRAPGATIRSNLDERFDRNYLRQRSLPAAACALAGGGGDGQPQRAARWPRRRSCSARVAERALGARRWTAAALQGRGAAAPGARRERRNAAAPLARRAAVCRCRTSAGCEEVAARMLAARGGCAAAGALAAAASVRRHGGRLHAMAPAARRRGREPLRLALERAARSGAAGRRIAAAARRSARRSGAGTPAGAAAGAVSRRRRAARRAPSAAGALKDLLQRAALPPWQRTRAAAAVRGTAGCSPLPACGVAPQPWPRAGERRARARLAWTASQPDQRRAAFEATGAILLRCLPVVSPAVLAWEPLTPSLERRIPYNDPIRLRHRWRRFLIGERHRCRFAGRDPRGARPQGLDGQARPLHQRRSGHHEPVPARRSVRHRRRHRDRPRPRATTSASCAPPPGATAISPPAASTSA